ncbi:hypothetical protein EIN_501730 [Entamoeba invadens IP1]|uniref:Uncharacterized protein n=1 Tax=Entamoeba invadens IP1 TaxID=370355 RepID=A0A0A1TUY6_ENTIV|nr:hypothetical protein EIN_501730 [Entamoeba invadens IP1]ELP84090.1 hypothetical protein EIN_501730 [Entamoeba invadens IP1]|eukprot:XP_004183436.1 hypothetical protein EIN_501730 [Entamoeba invadens IP1]
MNIIYDSDLQFIQGKDCNFCEMVLNKENLYYIIITANDCVVCGFVKPIISEKEENYVLGSDIFLASLVNSNGVITAKQYIGKNDAFFKLGNNLDCNVFHFGQFDMTLIRETDLKQPKFGAYTCETRYFNFGKDTTGLNENKELRAKRLMVVQMS